MRVAILAAAIAGIAVPALAHAFLEKASPAAGENLHAAPAKIELQFSEKLEPAFSNVTVTNAAGADMRAGPPSISGGEIDQPLKPLGPGRYRVSWHAVSVDTHRTAGKYNFLVLP
jgi:methionine-rich copper-binding protein CopC